MNLAHTEPVELYVVSAMAHQISTFLINIPIVEELEDRFGDKMDDILTAVKSSLSESHPTVNGTSEGGNAAQALQAESTVYTEYEEEYTQDAEQWEYDANEVVFDDTGEGAGVEGDLDMEDD